MNEQWRLPTATGEYVVSLADDRGGLHLDHWGDLIDGDAPRWSEPERRDQFRFPADAAPLDYATAGQRHAAFSELRIDRGEGWTGARWTLLDEGIEFETTPAGARLGARFTDETATLELRLVTETSRTHDVVQRTMTITNLDPERWVRLPRAFSAGWPLPLGRTARITAFAGAWAREFGIETIELRTGTWSTSSRVGITGLDTNPVVVLSSLDEDRGGAFGIGLAWSGNWRIQVDSPPSGDRVRVSAGVDDDTTTITLLPGESFQSPSSLGVWSARGADGVSEAWHDYQRTTLARGLDDPSRRPIVYNSWFSTEFDVRIDHQLRLAERAKRIGAEVFVVDDGWFTGRTSDRAGLGDWTPDPEKFPAGLAPLADAVLAAGMRFGIWIEPEGVNPDSELYRAHPDWVYRAGDRPLLTRRNQLVLNLGLPAVVDWVETTLRTLLTENPISYLKWDMNRPVSDGGLPGDPHGAEWSVRHTRNYYRVLRMIRTEFPHVTVEGCAAGGGRIDNAVLSLVDVVWPSDETGPRDRLAINHGYLSAYPAYAMSTWVTDDDGQIDRGPTSLEYRFVVAMSGALGVGAELLRWSEAELARAAELIELYRSIRSLVHTGRVIRHGDPREAEYALEYGAGDPRSPVVVLVYDRLRDRVHDRDRRRIRPSLLSPGSSYRLRGTDQVVSADVARTLGVAVPFALADDADVLIFDPLD